MKPSSPTAAVIVTYFPDDGFAARLTAIRAEFSPVLIVDNSAAPAVQARLTALGAAAGAEVLLNPSNAGLGTALNRAFTQLAATGHAWAAAFDQDSTPAPGFSAALRAAADDESGTNVRPAAVVGANWEDEARAGVASRHLVAGTVPLFFRRLPATRDLTDATCVITSGSLFHLPTWAELGGFDAGLFLDLVDTDYCLRARAAGRSIRVAAAAKLVHRRGRKRAVALGGGTWHPAFAPAARLQLQFRNRVLLAPIAARRAPHWLVFELIYALKLLAEVVFLEDGKLAKLAACALGTWDGLLGRAGPPR